MKTSTSPTLADRENAAGTPLAARAENPLLVRKFSPQVQADFWRCLARLLREERERGEG
jgi:hypothetical protein